MLPGKDPPDIKFPMLNGSLFSPFPSFPANSLTPLEQKLFQSLKTQGQVMKQIITQNQALYTKLIDLKKEISLLQVQCKGGAQTEDAQTERPSIRSVLDLVCHGNQDFSWKLDLAKGLPNPVCKGKYFHFKVKLATIGEQVFPPEERVQLMVAVYSAETPPKPILHNMTGGAMLKGYPESMLSHDPKEGCHVAFFKIQLNEVTSHFRNGWIFLVVQPKYSVADSFDSLSEHIQPLVVENLIIKAKETTCKRWRQEGLKPESEEDSDSQESEA